MPGFRVRKLLLELVTIAGAPPVETRNPVRGSSALINARIASRDNKKPRPGFAALAIDGSGHPLLHCGAGSFGYNEVSFVCIPYAPMGDINVGCFAF